MNRRHRSEAASLFVHSLHAEVVAVNRFFAGPPAIGTAAETNIAKQVIKTSPGGSPSGVDVTPNGRYLAAMIDEHDSGMQLSVWRLDGEVPLKTPMPALATVRPR